MTFPIDILGDRPPVMRPIQREEDLGPMRDDWRGEHLVRQMPARQTESGWSTKAPKSMTRALRQKAVRGLHKEGKTNTDIAATLGCSCNTVRSDLIAMGLHK